LLPLKAEYAATGGVFVEHAGPTLLMPGVTMLGPVPRVHPERNWGSPRGGPAGRVQTPDGIVEDTVPEDTSIVIDTAEGLVLISGCGHAGIVNSMEFAQKAVRNAPVVASIGGFHLFAASDKTLAWTAGRLKALGVKHLRGAHCTGIEALLQLELDWMIVDGTLPRHGSVRRCRSTPATHARVACCRTPRATPSATGRPTGSKRVFGSGRRLVRSRPPSRHARRRRPRS
jgi:hypothetical protein